LEEHEAKYQNGEIIRARLSENTSKHHRKKTSEEEVGEQLSQHLQIIAEKHEEIQESHAEAQEHEKADDTDELDHFKVSGFIEMKEELEERQPKHMEEGSRTKRGRGELRSRMVQGNMFAQLGLAFMNRSDHYHRADLYDIKVHQSWMPAYQGVSAKDSKNRA
jgi:myo-inositol-1-phosphate synthase